MTEAETLVLRQLVSRHEAYPHNLALLGMGPLAKATGLEREQVVTASQSLVDQGLAETTGILMRALMPQAREALSFRGDRRRLSALAVA